MDIIDSCAGRCDKIFKKGIIDVRGKGLAWKMARKASGATPRFKGGTTESDYGKFFCYYVGKS